MQIRSIVTGGAGFIGSHVAERLKQRGDDVLVVDNLASGGSRVKLLETLGIRIDTTDIRQERLLKLMADFDPVEIYHLAAQIDVRRSVSDPILDAKINIIGLLRVLEAARQVGARMIFASSGGTIYGEVAPDALPISELSSGRPTSPYGITKKVAEDYLNFYRSVHGVESVSLALANVYGPRQDPHGEAGVVAIFGLQLLAGERCTIFGDGKQTRDFVYVEDVADAFLVASDKGAGETFNIGTGRETSVEELLKLMTGICRTEWNPIYQPERPGEIDRTSLDPSKAKSLLGWSPRTTLEEGLERTVEAIRHEVAPAT